MRFDLISVIERAYAGGETDEGWLTDLVASARPGLDGGLGVTGFFYDVSDPSRMRVWSPVFLGTPPGALEALYAINSQAPVDWARELFRPTSLSATLSERFGVGEKLVELPLHQQVLAPLGVSDFLSVSATDPSGVGCLIGAPLPKVCKLPRRDAAMWDRLAAHIAAGARLRLTERREAGEAVLSSDGKIQHAEGEAATPGARDALAQSARAIDRARGRLRRTDPEEAVALWTALVAGRWTLVDSFDHDGRRYLIARRNDPAVLPFAKELTRREKQVLGYAALGHSNKLIAYEMGLSPSTVAMHLSSAASKLGTKSRVALIQRYRQMCQG